MARQDGPAEQPSPSGTAVDSAPDLSVMDTSNAGPGNSSCSAPTAHISGLRAANQRDSDYSNINRGAVKVPARPNNKLIAMSVAPLHPPHSPPPMCEE